MPITVQVYTPNTAIRLKVAKKFIGIVEYKHFRNNAYSEYKEGIFYITEYLDQPPSDSDV